MFNLVILVGIILFFFDFFLLKKEKRQASSSLYKMFVWYAIKFLKLQVILIEYQTKTWKKRKEDILTLNS